MGIVKKGLGLGTGGGGGSSPIKRSLRAIAVNNNVFTLKPDETSIIFIVSVSGNGTGAHTPPLELSRSMLNANNQRFVVESFNPTSRNIGTDTKNINIVVKIAGNDITATVNDLQGTASTVLTAYGVKLTGVVSDDRTVEGSSDSSPQLADEVLAAKSFTPTAANQRYVVVESVGQNSADTLLVLQATSGSNVRTITFTGSELAASSPSSQLLLLDDFLVFGGDSSGNIHYAYRGSASPIPSVSFEVWRYVDLRFIQTVINDLVVSSVPLWVNGAGYKVGDIVRDLEHDVFICVRDVVAGSADSKRGSDASASWHSVSEYRGDWVRGVYLKKGNIVTLGTTPYFVLNDVNGSTTRPSSDGTNFLSLKHSSNLTDTEIGDKAFSNPPTDLNTTEQQNVRTRIGAASAAALAATLLTDAQIGDKAFSNPPNDLTNTEKTAVRTAIGAGTGSGSGSDFVINDLTEVTPSATDAIPLADASDSNKNKKTLFRSLALHVLNSMRNLVQITSPEDAFDIVVSDPDEANSQRMLLSVLAKYVLDKRIKAALPEPSSANNGKIIEITATGFVAVDKPSGGTPATPSHVSYKAGVSDDSTAVAAEFTIDSANGRVTIPAYNGHKYWLIARLASEADITSIVLASDSTNANQIGGFNKASAELTISSASYNVWVSENSLTAATDTTLIVT